MALVPIRVWVIPKMPFTDEELEALDGPVASAFVSPDPRRRCRGCILICRPSNLWVEVCKPVIGERGEREMRQRYEHRYVYCIIIVKMYQDHLHSTTVLSTIHPTPSLGLSSFVHVSVQLTSFLRRDAHNSAIL
jgi:hypothetical protein